MYFVISALALQIFFKVFRVNGALFQALIASLVYVEVARLEVPICIIFSAVTALVVPTFSIYCIFCPFCRVIF